MGNGAKLRSAEVTFLFGNCEVRTATREVLVDGRMQTVPPKVFDLLAYLLLERQRAVSKQDLVREVWRGADLSDSVLARTIMLVRRLIGDDAERPVWIQNVYGFGYRFGGIVLEQVHSPTQTSSVPEPSGCVASTYRLGVLPLQNQTQDPSLAWTQLGLMALVGYALEKDRRLAITELGGDFLRQLPTGTSTQAAAREACELFGLDGVVLAVLRSQADTLWMDYQIFGRTDAGAVGSLRDADPVVLGERLAKAIAGHVLTRSNVSGRLLSQDPFVNQVFARATECIAAQDWRTAAALLGAAAALEPENWLIDLELVRCMVLLKDPVGLQRARDLLARMNHLNDPRLMSGCHDLIAQALNLKSDPHLISQCIEHREKALEWAEQAGPTDWAIALRIATGNFFMEMGQYDRSRLFLDRALADSRATDNLIRAAVCQQNLAIADRNQGNLIQAKQRLEEALQIWRRLPKRPVRGHALMHLGLVDLHLGLFDDAGRQCDDAVDNFHLDQLRTYDGATAAGVSLIYLHLGRFDAVKQLAHHLVCAFEGDDIKPVPFHAALGCAAIAQGNATAAREHLLVAVGHSGVWPGLSFRLRCLHALLHLELAYGDVTQLESCRQAFENLERGAELPEWNAGIQYIAAALHLLRDERRQALLVLKRIATELPMSMTTQMARLDASWLILEGGDSEAASQFMSGAPTWRDGHPAGLALKARWQAAAGHFDEAHRLQLLALARHRSRPHPDQTGLGGLYERATATRRAAQAKAIPQLSRLLCSTWFCGPTVPSRIASPAT